ARKKIVKKCVMHGAKREQTAKYIERFSNFFIIPPVDIDPFGILNKIEHLLDTSEDRFKEASRQIIRGKDEELLADVSMSLKGLIGLNQLAKIVRNAVEMAKKMNNFQLALIIQMQLPMLEKIARGELEGTKAFLERHPIGDAIGPYVVASLTEKRGKEISEGMVASSGMIAGRKAILVKATGPGARVGKPGTAVEKLIAKNKIARVITVDAAAKMEGEKTGTIAEGVGVAMGGAAFKEKAIIEELTMKKGLPLDAIAVKMGMDEAIRPMVVPVVKAKDDAIKAIEDAANRAPKNATLILLGVGNTVGVGDTKEEIKDVEKIVLKKEKERKAKETKKVWWKRKPAEDMEADAGIAPVTRPNLMAYIYAKLTFNPCMRQNSYKYLHRLN
ncbi:MAG: DUF1512 family protein, partial [Candidatus Aenigmarchaeota archaeon]|nr:DUF1512 family protein [Candidatus Aenigmarchaeota archaeon]